MLQGLLTEQTQRTSYQDHQAREFLHPLYEIHDAGQHVAATTFRMRLLGDFVLLLNDVPVSGLDVPRLRSLLAYLALHRGMPQARSRIAYTLQCYQGDLLPGCYDEWLGSERERLQQTYQSALERLVELLEQEGCVAEAIRMAQRLLRIDPLQEATYRCLMRLHSARHDRGAVMRTYQTCAAVLKRELGIEPGAKTRRTFQQLMQVEE